MSESLQISPIQTEVVDFVDPSTPDLRLGQQGTEVFVQPEPASYNRQPRHLGPVRGAIAGGLLLIGGAVGLERASSAEAPQLAATSGQEAGPSVNPYFADSVPVNLQIAAVTASKPAVRMMDAHDDSQQVETAPTTEVSTTTPEAENLGNLYDVVDIIDGDTITVNMNDKIVTVRMIGVDTPETHDPNRPVGCFGPEAAAFTDAALRGQKIYLVIDPTQASTNQVLADGTIADKYGRLLFDIVLPETSADGTVTLVNFNEDLVARGYGKVFVYLNNPPANITELMADQDQAIEQHLGLWAIDGCNGQT